MRKRKENTQECGKNIGAGGSRSARINADQRGWAQSAKTHAPVIPGQRGSMRITADGRKVWNRKENIRGLRGLAQFYLKT